MRKVDRLYEIIQLLRGGRLRTAKELSENLSISIRTVYRDIDALVASGVPIEGERGVGYVIRNPIDIPPLHFTPLEYQALLLGVEFISATTDDQVASAAREAALKIKAVTSQLQSPKVKPLAHVYFKSAPETKARLQLLRGAIEDNRKVQLDYTDNNSDHTTRTVRPLALEFWGKTWTLTAWCEHRDDTRMFRLDRIKTVKILNSHFNVEVGKTYKEHIKRMTRDE